MRKYIVVLITVLFLFTAFTLSAQNTNKDDLYAKTTFISRVLTHELGYVIYYLKSDLQMGKLYLPYSLFKANTGTGEIIFDRHPSYPYFVTMYSGGKVVKIKLFLHLFSLSGYGATTAGCSKTIFDGKR